MKLSIITVNYRSWDHIEAALSALQDEFSADWEIIVVDNESDTAESVEVTRTVGECVEYFTACCKSRYRTSLRWVNPWVMAIR